MSQLPSVSEVAKSIDHALLKPAMTVKELESGLNLAKQYNVFSVCVRPSDVSLARDYLATSDVKVGTVIGFPHGVTHTEVKGFEIRQAALDGATEVDIVLNIGWLKSGLLQEVEDELTRLVLTAKNFGVDITKVILETAYLSADEIRLASQIVERSGADFVKTSTGFAGEGATLPNLEIMRAAVSTEVEVKASGGVTSLDILLDMRKLGVTRFGTSATKVILDDLQHRLSSAGEKLEQEYLEGY